MRFIDTNIIIRYLAQPTPPIDQARHLAATALLRANRCSPAACAG